MHDSDKDTGPTRPSWKLSAGVALLAGFVYAAGIEPYWIESVHIEISCPRLPRAFDGYVIHQISDLHMKSIGRRERKVIDILESLPPPDLTVFTGDLIHTRAGIEPLLTLAQSIKSTNGVYAIFGNSEYKNGVRPVEFAGRLYERGIRALMNQHVVLEKDGDEIALAGVEDPWSDADDLDLALTGIPDDVFKLVLMHSPDGIAGAAVRGVDLVLSGHTHGGQVSFPIVGPLVTHSVMGTRMSSGYYGGHRLRSVIGIRPGRTQLYVTRGIGISGLALRFLCRPELTVITLRRGIPNGKRIPTQG